MVKYTEALDELSKMRETNMATDRRRIAAEAELQKVLAAQASKASEQRRENVKSEQSSSYGREMLSILQKQWDENGTPASGKYEFMVKLMDKIDGFGPQLTEGIESELEMAHVSSVIARLHKRFGVLDSALKGFDDNIKTLEKQTKFIPMQQVAEINKVRSYAVLRTVFSLRLSQNVSPLSKLPNRRSSHRNRIGVVRCAKFVLRRTT